MTFVRLREIAHGVGERIGVEFQLLKDPEEIRVRLRNHPRQDVARRDRLAAFARGGRCCAVQRVDGIVC